MANSSTLNVIINVSQTGSATLSRVTSGLKSLGVAAAKAAATGLAAASVAVVGLTAKLVSMGSGAEEMLGKFNVVFGSMAGTVTAQLTDFASEVGRSRFELMGFASTIQDTLVPLGFARDAAAEMSTNVVKLATDLGSFNDIDTATVIEDIQSALVGNTETLRKYGVVASQAAIEQFALTNNLWDGEAAMDAQTKAAAIMGLIIDSTTDAQGDAARTSASWANQMRGLKGQITDVGTEIGLRLLPVLSPLLKLLGDLAQGVLGFLTDQFDRFQPVIDKVAFAFERLAAGNINGFFTAISGAIQTLGETIGLEQTTIDNWIFAWETLKEVVTGQKTLWEGLKEVMSLFLPQETIDKLDNIVEWAMTLGGGDGGGVLGELIGKLNVLLGMSDEDIPTFGESMVEMFVSIVDAIDLLITTSDALKANWEVLKTVGSTIWEQIKLNLSGSIGTILGWINSLNAAIDGLILKMFSLTNPDPSQFPGIPGNQGGGGDVIIPPPSGPGGGFSDQPSNSQSSGNVTNNQFVMNVNGGDVGSMQNEFGGMAAAAAGI